MKLEKEANKPIDVNTKQENTEKPKKPTYTQERHNEFARKKANFDQQEDVLKKKGDIYEQYIGSQFEKKGDLVIYNGFVRGYEDDGVDIIAIDVENKTINLVQCKNWTKKPMVLEDIIKIYEKLEHFRLDTISRYPHVKDKYKIHFNADSEQMINLINGYDFKKRKTLYVSSDKIIDLNIGKTLKLIKQNIFKYQDMKIVIKGMG